jgi:acylaminoacyl-peptidase
MLRSGLMIGLAIAVAGSSVAASPSETPSDTLFTAERVFDVEYASDVQISPDGRTIVYVRRGMDRLKDRVTGDLWLLNVASGAHRPLVTGSGSAGAPRWSPDGTRLAYISGANGRPELRVRFMDSGQDFSLAQLEQSPGAPVWSPDGKAIAFTMLKPAEGLSLASPIKAPKDAEWSPPVKVFDDLVFRFDGRGYLTPGTAQVYVVPAEGGTPRQITQGETDASGPQWLGTNALLISTNINPDPELDPIESDIFRVDLATGAMTALTTRDGPDYAPQASPDGRQIAYLGYDDKVLSYQQTDLYLMNADGTNVRNLTAGYDRSIDGFAWAADGRTLIVQAETDGEISLLELSLIGRTRVLIDDLGGTAITRPYVGGDFSVASGTGARSVIAYTQLRAYRPADVAVLEGGSPRRLTDLNADTLDHLTLARIEEVTIPSSHDGLPIEAWIAFPPNFKADGSFPMILEIHGGPFAMYGPSFAMEIERFAAEGYVTVYVNPRGSTGYGEAFAQEIDLAYPGHDYDDLMSVVDHVIAQDYVDPKRLFVTGGSGGGLLTAWIVGKTDRFAAAATVKPVINWATMAMSADIAAFVARHWIRALPWEDPDTYFKRSPISLVGNVTTPTLVMVGEEDWRTPTWEAEQFYTALKLRKVETALVRIPGSSHAIAARPSRMNAKVDNIMGWFAKYDPAKVDAPDPGEVSSDLEP